MAAFMTALYRARGGLCNGEKLNNQYAALAVNAAQFPP